MAAMAATSMRAPAYCARLAASSMTALRMPASAVMAGVVHEVGLGGGKQDAVDAPAEELRQPGVGALAEGAEHVGQRRLEVGDRRRPGIEGREHVDEHDLPVEPGEMVEEERPHHMGDIGVVAPFHHVGERASRG
jgi:hypothetical protein